LAVFSSPFAVHAALGGRAVPAILWHLIRTGGSLTDLPVNQRVPNPLSQVEDYSRNKNQAAPLPLRLILFEFKIAFCIRDLFDICQRRFSMLTSSPPRSLNPAIDLDSVTPFDSSPPASNTVRTSAPHGLYVALIPSTAKALLHEVRLSFGCFRPTRSLGLGLKAVQQGAKGPSGLTTLPNDE